MIYMQEHSESKNYHTSAGVKYLLERIPLLCSIRYFSEVVKNKDMVSKVIRNVNFISIKKAIVDRERGDGKK